MAKNGLGRGAASPILFGLVTILYALMATVYLRCPQALSPVPGPILKSLPILLLATAVLAIGGRSMVLIAAGLIASAAGDIAIESSFPMGMGAFLVAHLCYIASFVRDRQPGGRRMWWAAPAIAWTAYVMYRIHDGRAVGGSAMEAAVFAYVIVITAMFAFSLLRRPAPFHLVPIGAAMFIVSDSLLAWDRFVADLPHMGSLVMLTYYTAQLLIAIGALALPQIRRPIY